ncbi:aldehyde ferredoxin oxidoreductase family protein [Chloroflexota bacterium]
MNGQEEYYGYAGKILRVNLTKKESSTEPFPREWMRQYIGGEAVAARILYDEVPPTTHPLSPDNKVILSMGPLVGTLAPGSGRITLTTKSPITEIYSDSNAGGQWGPEMKYAGYDHLILEGASEDPVYLWIDDDRVEIRDASHLWGKTTWEADDIIKAELGDNTIQIAGIGPAGENLSSAACLILNRARACGRMGLGAVIGSKKVKAIAVRGTKGLKIAHPGRFIKECRKLFDKILNDGMYWMISQGTIAMPDLSWDGSPSKPTPLVRYGHSDKDACDTYAEISCKNVRQKVMDRDMACFNCPVHCGNWSSIKQGRWKGEKGEGFELNIQENCIYMDACSDVWFLPKYNFLCNQLGLGVDEAALPITFSMWLFEKGLLTEKDTGGIKLKWGDTDTVLKLLKMIAYREGFGDFLADGTRKMAQKIGRGAEYWSKNIKGAEVIADTRLTYETTLAEAVSPRGACHLKGLSLFSFYSRSTDYLTPEFREKMREVYESPFPIVLGDYHWTPYATRYLIRLMSTYDALGMCVFNSHYMLFRSIMLEDLPPLIEAATGITFTQRELAQCADRARIIQRSFNHLLGLNRKDDIPAQHTFEYPVTITSQGKKMEFVLNKEHYDKALSEFYRISGYDEKTGIPTEETLKRLGLEKIARDLEHKGMLPK